MSQETYRVRSAQTWSRARDAYLAGQSAEVVCRRFHLGLSAFRKRAAAGEWRRSDFPDPEPEPEIDLDDLPETSPAEMAETALRLVQLAIARSDPTAASRWLRVYESLSALAGTEVEAPAERAPAPDRFHAFHPDFSEPAVVPAMEAMLSRAERRRRLRDARKRGSSA